MEYNTQLKKLVLPEYGRNIQKMVDYCQTIEDREERTRCAYAIITAMSNLMQLQKNSGALNKLWDHLAIMSDFNLDIDYPTEIIPQESLNSQPEAINYQNRDFSFRHYGKYLEQMIYSATQYPEGEERDALILLIANHMKKTMLAVNPDGVEDERIFRDLADMSHGAIRLNSETTKLHQFQEAPTAVTTKKKKKKK
ncbi:MAG: DUF4290 domain-containing protein [Muribaculaceae bacterium]|nr:DUF4290 domain-containing protein [Muribaculaceae bacterium]